MGYSFGPLFSLSSYIAGQLHVRRGGRLSVAVISFEFSDSGSNCSSLINYLKSWLLGKAGEAKGVQGYEHVAGYSRVWMLLTRDASCRGWWAVDKTRQGRTFNGYALTTAYATIVWQPQEALVSTCRGTSGVHGVSSLCCLLGGAARLNLDLEVLVVHRMMPNSTIRLLGWSCRHSGDARVCVEGVWTLPRVCTHC